MRNIFTATVCVTLGVTALSAFAQESEFDYYRPSKRDIFTTPVEYRDQRDVDTYGVVEPHWKLYQNHLLGYEVSHPNGLGDIQVQRPRNRLRRILADELIVRFAASNIEMNGRLSIYVKHYDHIVDMTHLQNLFSDYSWQPRTTLQENRQHLDGFRQLTSWTFTHNGFPAFSADYSAFEEKTYKYRFVALARGLDVYTLIYRVEEEHFNEEIPIFQQILNGFNAQERRFPVSSSSSTGPSSTELFGTLYSLYNTGFPSSIQPEFTDVDEQHSHAPAIAWAQHVEVARGYSDGSFRPDAPVTRAEFLKMLYASLQTTVPEYQLTPFLDVPEDAWYTPYVSLAYRGGHVQGYNDHTFRPANTMSIAEALKTAYSILGVQVGQNEEVWYEPYMTHAFANAVVSTPLLPHDQLTRKEAAWIIWRLFQ